MYYFFYICVYNLINRNSPFLIEIIAMKVPDKRPVMPFYVNTTRGTLLVSFLRFSVMIQ